MRVLVCGGRDFGRRAGERELLWTALGELLPGITLVIHGGASGADSLAGDWAERNEIACLRVPAQWKKHGRSAGCRRNEDMLRRSKPELAIACPGGVGTADMVRRLEAAGVPVKKILAHGK